MANIHWNNFKATTKKDRTESFGFAIVLVLPTIRLENGQGEPVHNPYGLMVLMLYNPKPLGNVNVPIHGSEHTTQTWNAKWAKWLGNLLNTDSCIHTTILNHVFQVLWDANNSYGTMFHKGEVSILVMELYLHKNQQT